MSKADERLREALPADLTELEPLVEVSHAAQAEILGFRERYDRLGVDAPLPPKSLREIREGRRRYLNLQERLAALAKRHAPLAEPGGASGVDPLLRFQGISVSLVAALALYDNYLSLITILKDDRLRRLLNHPDYGYGIREDAYWKIVDGLHSANARRILRQLIESFSRADEALGASDPISARLRQTVESSVSYRHAREASLAAQLPRTWQIRRTRFLDALDGLSRDAVETVSRAFGNGIGLVELRKGKLWQDEGVLRQLQGVLQPLDLLLDKTPFRLTDVFIPGHFGHVAIWMGTDAELDALGVFVGPESSGDRLRFQETIRAGRSVLEALRTGVELNTLEQFLNVDDVAVLRPIGLSPDEVVGSLVRGFGQVGKEYDFNFDIESTGSIVCSELPYHVYPGVAWQTESTLGRFTISPDEVAAQALREGGAFELQVLCHDGRRVDAATQHTRMEALMRDAWF